MKSILFLALVPIYAACSCISARRTVPLDLIIRSNTYFRDYHDTYYIDTAGDHLIFNVEMVEEPNFTVKNDNLNEFEAFMTEKATEIRDSVIKEDRGYFSQIRLWPRFKTGWNVYLLPGFFVLMKDGRLARVKW